MSSHEKFYAWFSSRCAGTYPPGFKADMLAAYLSGSLDGQEAMRERAAAAGYKAAYSDENAEVVADAIRDLRVED